MRKIFSYAMVAALAFGLASCSKEAGLGEGGETTGALAFTIEMPKSAYTPVTYADISTTQEWNVAAIDLYAFNGADGVYIGKLASGTDYTLTPAGSHQWTINVAGAWVTANEGKTVNFYFVGNDASSTQGAHDALTNFAAPSKEEDFKELLTDALAVSGTPAKAELITINGSTKNLLFSGLIEGVTIASKVQKTVTLKRREARFDIVNPANAVIDLKKVLVSNAARRGFIFADAQTTPAIPTASLQEIDLTGLIYTGNDLTSVFYLYPTTLGTGGTEITITAEVNGESVVFVFNGAASIEANKRYKLVLNASSLTFTLIAADYDEGDELTVVPSDETVTLGTITGATDIDRTFVHANENTAGTFTVPVNSIYGTTATVNLITGSGLTFSTALVAPTPTQTVTYGYGVTDTYTFNLPVTSGDADKPFFYEVIFTSKADATKGVVVYVMRALFSELVDAGIENILYYDVTAGLNLDGAGVPLNFKWGSLVGVNAAIDVNDVFDASDIVWQAPEYTYDLKGAIGATTGTAAWSQIPFADVANYPTAIPTDKAADGIGDPCRFAKKGGTGLGTYKMPQGNPYNGSTSVGTWGTYGNVMGRTIDGQFYPAIGSRYPNTGQTHSANQTGGFWSSTVNTSLPGNIHMLLFNYKNGWPSTSYGRGYGFNVRCVPN